jgi:putative tricarboxylic transport membrane protein
MCVLGSYAIRNSMFDVYLMAIMGLIGYVLQRLRIPVAPVVLGLVLGSTLENQYRTALILNEGSYQGFLDSSVALGFFILTALMIAMQLWSTHKNSKSNATV